MIDIYDYLYESVVTVDELCDFIIKRYPQFKFKKFRCDYCHKILYSNEFHDSDFQIDVFCFDWKEPKYQFRLFIKVHGKFLEHVPMHVITISSIDDLIDRFINEFFSK